MEIDLSGLAFATQTPEVELFFSLLTKDVTLSSIDERKDLIKQYLDEKLEEPKKMFIHDFIDVIERLEFTMEQKELTQPYDVKNVLNENHEGESQLKSFLTKHKFKTMNQLKRKLHANIDEVSAFFQDASLCDNTISKKILGIRYLSLEHLRRSFKGFKLHINYKNFHYYKDFLAFYLWIKTVRNKVCHACPLHTLDDNFNEQQKRELQRIFGVDTSTVTAYSLSKNITSALNCLEACITVTNEIVNRKFYICLPTSNSIITRTQLNTLFENVAPYETVKVYVIKGEKSSKSSEQTFLATLEEYEVLNDFFFNVENINTTDKPSLLLSKLTPTVEAENKISIEATYLTAIQMHDIMLFLNSAFHKGAVIENVIYGKYKLLTEMFNCQVGNIDCDSTEISKKAEMSDTCKSRFNSAAKFQRSIVKKHCGHRQTHSRNEVKRVYNYFKF